MSTTGQNLLLTAKPESERTIKFDANAKAEEGTTLGTFVPYGDTSAHSKAIVERALKQRSEAKEGGVVYEPRDEDLDDSDATNDSAEDIETEDDSENNYEDDSDDDSGSVDEDAAESKAARQIRNDSEDFWKLSDLIWLSHLELMWRERMNVVLRVQGKENFQAEIQHLSRGIQTHISTGKRPADTKIGRIIKYATGTSTSGAGSGADGMKKE
ncbi:hypothetical protein DFP73DRAFT_583236 [Morchella snyderi]|nr:hypothetical protein DFP73DRAFT_583236 [Morchella snyderi]